MDADRRGGQRAPIVRQCGSPPERMRSPVGFTVDLVVHGFAGHPPIQGIEFPRW